jgi:hypothetical protein
VERVLGEELRRRQSPTILMPQLYTVQHAICPDPGLRDSRRTTCGRITGDWGIPKADAAGELYARHAPSRGALADGDDSDVRLERSTPDATGSPGLGLSARARVLRAAGARRRLPLSLPLGLPRYLSSRTGNPRRCRPRYRSLPRTGFLAERRPVPVGDGCDMGYGPTFPAPRARASWRITFPKTSTRTTPSGIGSVSTKRNTR